MGTYERRIRLENHHYMAGYITEESVNPRQLFLS